MFFFLPHLTAGCVKMETWSKVESVLQGGLPFLRCPLFSSSICHAQIGRPGSCNMSRLCPQGDVCGRESQSVVIKTTKMV